MCNLQWMKLGVQHSRELGFQDEACLSFQLLTTACAQKISSMPVNGRIVVIIFIQLWLILNYIGSYSGLKHSHQIQWFALWACLLVIVLIWKTWRAEHSHSLGESLSHAEPLAALIVGGEKALVSEQDWGGGSLSPRLLHWPTRNSTIQYIGKHSCYRQMRPVLIYHPSPVWTC